MVNRDVWLCGKCAGTLHLCYYGCCGAGPSLSETRFPANGCSSRQSQSIWRFRGKDRCQGEKQKLDTAIKNVKVFTNRQVWLCGSFARILHPSYYGYRGASPSRLDTRFPAKGCSSRQAQSSWRFDACYDRGASFFFLTQRLDFGSLRPLFQKLILEKTTTATG